MKETIEEREGWWCTICEEEVDEPEPIYECSSCGSVFCRSNSSDGMSHKCAECGRWGAKVIEHGCPTCEDQEELEWVTIYTCSDCGEEFVSDPEEHNCK